MPLDSNCSVIQSVSSACHLCLICCQVWLMLSSAVSQGHLWSLMVCTYRLHACLSLSGMVSMVTLFCWLSLIFFCIYTCIRYMDCSSREQWMLFSLAYLIQKGICQRRTRVQLLVYIQRDVSAVCIWWWWSLELHKVRLYGRWYTWMFVFCM